MTRKILLPFQLEELDKYVTSLRYRSTKDSKAAYVFCDEIAEEYNNRYEKKISLAKARAISEVLFELFKERLTNSTYDKFKGNSITFLAEMQPSEYNYSEVKDEIKKFIEHYNNYEELDKRIKQIENVLKINE